MKSKAGSNAPFGGTGKTSQKVLMNKTVKTSNTPKKTIGASGASTYVAGKGLQTAINKPKGMLMKKTMGKIVAKGAMEGVSSASQGMLMKKTTVKKPQQQLMKTTVKKK